MFTKYIELEKQYYKWIKAVNVDDRPFNVIFFMAVYNLINDENVTKFLEIFGGGQNENSNCN